VTALRVHRAPRVGWGVADQALSSLLNLVLGLLVARAVSAGAFGAFALAFSTYLLVVGICRALVAEPLLVRASDDPSDWRLSTRAATGAALVIGVVFGVLCVATGAVAGGVLGHALVALGLVLPVLLLQDMWRYAFFAAARGGRAFVTDLSCAAILIPVLTVLSVKSVDGVEPFILCWGLAALLAAIVGVALARIVPSVRLARSWIIGQKDLAFPFAGEFVVVSAGELALFGIGGLVGLGAVGALRGGQILLGPVRVLQLGIRLAAIPDGVRALRRSSSELRRMCVVLSVLLTAAPLAWGGALLLLPDRVGEAALGSTWKQADATLVPLSLALAGTGAMTGAFIGLRALAAAGRSLRLRLMTAPFIVAGALVGAAIGGATGAAWGTAVVVWSSVGLWWWQFRDALATHSPPTLDRTRPPVPAAVLRADRAPVMRAIR
jgi:hypothetical protein